MIEPEFFFFLPNRALQRNSWHGKLDMKMLNPMTPFWVRAINLSFVFYLAELNRGMLDMSLWLRFKFVPLSSLSLNAVQWKYRPFDAWWMTKSTGSLRTIPVEVSSFKRTVDDEIHWVIAYHSTTILTSLSINSSALCSDDSAVLRHHTQLRVNSSLLRKQPSS